MELNNQNGVHVQNGIAKEAANKVAQNGNGTQSKKEPANGKEADKPKPAQLKDESPELHQPGQPQKEDPKAEVLQVKEEAKSLNLEAKLKTVDTLYRKSVQRLNLISRMKQLEAFEVALVQEHDELEDNAYQGCKLIIEDDKKRQFVTAAPGLIRLVSQFIYTSCDEKKAEIEESIIFPNA